MSGWSPDSWKQRPAKQQATYPDEGALAAVQRQIAALPPLVTSWEVEALRGYVARAAAGDAFLLQGGDCAESFADCASDNLTNKLKILLQMSLVLVHAIRRPVIRIGRIAGQYAKPRSADTETKDGLTLPAYRGDSVNGEAFTLAARTPDPSRMLLAYQTSALTLNFLRALSDGGFADLEHPENWDVSFASSSIRAQEYRRIVESIRDSLSFVSTVSGLQAAPIRRIDLFTSHEGLALPYEQAQTRQVPRRSGWYNLSTHMPWIGMRTLDLDGAHVEFHRGIENPIGVKVGTGLSPEALVALLTRLDPEHLPGRVSLIHRFGADDVATHLPPMIEAVRRAGRTHLWICDPMHGNTEATKAGIKTRRFDRIVLELERSFEVHAACGSRLGGVHLELTGEDVTECVGGARGLAEGDLDRAYRSRVDPRLNYEQALEVAMRIAAHLRKARGG